MKKRNLILASAVASALALAAGAAQAGTLAATGITYAKQIAGQAITVPAGAAVVYTANGSISTTSTFTFTLLDGATFSGATTPTATTSAAGGTLTKTAGGAAGDTYVTFTLSGANIANTETVTLGAFSVNGTSNLSTSGNTLRVQISRTVAAGDTDGIPATTGVAYATSADAGNNTVTITDNTNASENTTIDIPSSAMKFLSGNAGSAPTTVIELADPVTVANAAGTQAATDGATDMTASAGSVSIGGNMTGFTSVYLAVGAGQTCAATAPAGAIAGTISASGVAFTGLTVAQAYTLCAVVDGTSMIQAGNLTITATGTYSSGNSTTTNSHVLAYNGYTANVNYVVGNGAGYAMYTNVVNPAGAAAPVYIALRKADGTVKTGTLIASLGANQSKLLTVADINTATGAGLATEADRAAITVLSTAPIRVTNFMLNPGNAVTQIGQSF